MKFNGNVSIIYEVDKLVLEDMEKILTMYNSVVDDDNGEETYSKILKEFSEVKYHKIDTEKEIVSVNSTYSEYNLKQLFLAKLFKSSPTEYSRYYVIFSFKVTDGELYLTNDINSKLVNGFFKDNEKFNSYSRDNKKLSQLLGKGTEPIKGLYFRIKDDEFSEVDLKTVLKLNKGDLLDTYKGLINDDHKQFINYKDNIAVEYAPGKDAGFDRVNHYLLAIAYKDYYKEKSFEISKKAFELDSNKYDEILSYAEKIAKFEATYYFKNPTEREFYEGYHEKFKINQLHDEFLESLNGLVKYLGIVYNKKEAIRLEVEQREREEQRTLEQIRINEEKQAREDQRTLEQDKLNKIAIIFTILGGITVIDVIPTILDFINWLTN